MSNVHQLTLYNSGGSIELGENGSHILRSYTPQAPQKKLLELEEFQHHGSSVKDVRIMNATESAEIMLVGNHETCQAVVESIELFFSEAEEWHRSRGGKRGYVYFQPGDTGTVWRSPIFSGSIQPGDGSFKYEWHASRMSVLITWTRAYYWENTTQTTVQLYNATGGTATTLGIYPLNDSDGTPNYSNYADIEGTAITGSIPTPAHITLEHALSGGAKTEVIWAGNQVFGTYDAPLVIEAEDNDAVAGTAAPSADSTRSGGYYNTCTWTGDTETSLFSWTIPSATLAKLKGHKYKVLAVFRDAGGPPTDVLFRLKLYFATYTTEIWAGQAKYFPDAKHVQELGTVQLPPWLPGETDVIDIEMRLLGEKTGGDTFQLDALYLIPVASYARYYPKGYGIDYEEYLVDDPDSGFVWVYWPTDSAKGGYYIKTGNGIMLYPGKTNRLVFCWNTSTGVVDNEDTMDLTVKYRERVLTV